MHPFTWSQVSQYQKYLYQRRTTSKHFAEIQVGIHDVPNDFFADNVMAIERVSDPDKSRLMRMYNNQYDIRRFILDNSKFGSLLSDYSGVSPYQSHKPIFDMRKVMDHRNICLMQFSHNHTDNR